MTPRISIIKRKSKGFFTPETLPLIKQAVYDVHEIISRASLLVKAFYLDWFDKRDNNQDVDNLVIDHELIRLACLVVQGDAKLNVRKPRVTKGILEDDPTKTESNSKMKAKVRENKDKSRELNQVNFPILVNLYNDIFGRDNIVKSDLSLSHILTYSIDNLVTAYKNNILSHFIKYPKRFIKCDLMASGLSSKEAQKCSAIISNYYLYVQCSPRGVESIDEKMTTILQKYNAQNKYLGLFPNFLVQTKEPHTRCYELKACPWVYLAKMVEINKLLETDFPNLDKRYTKLFNPLPFHSSWIPMHIRIDTSGLCQLLMDKAKILDFARLYAIEHPMEQPLKMTSKADLLSSFEKLHGRKAKDREEEGQFATKLWSFITNLEKCRQWKELSNLCQDDKPSIFDNAVVTDGVSISFQMIEKSCFGRKERFKKKIKKKDDTKTDDTNIEKEGKAVVPINISSSSKLLGCDPGKHDILAITDGITTIRYTKGQRQIDTLSHVQRDISLSLRRKNNLEDFESKELNKYSKKSCHINVFKHYCVARMSKKQNAKSCTEKHSLESSNLQNIVKQRRRKQR